MRRNASAFSRANQNKSDAPQWQTKTDLSAFVARSRPPRSAHRVKSRMEAKVPISAIIEEGRPKNSQHVSTCIATTQTQELADLVACLASAQSRFSGLASPDALVILIELKFHHFGDQGQRQRVVLAPLCICSIGNEVSPVELTIDCFRTQLGTRSIEIDHENQQKTTSVQQIS